MGQIRYIWDKNSQIRTAGEENNDFVLWFLFKFVRKCLIKWNAFLWYQSEYYDLWLVNFDTKVTINWNQDNRIMFIDLSVKNVLLSPFITAEMHTVLRMRIGMHMLIFHVLLITKTCITCWIFEMDLSKVQHGHNHLLS